MRHLQRLPAAARCLSRAEALHDFGTHTHAVRVGSMVRRLARELGMFPHAMEEIAQATMLHDVGKFALAIEILQKTAPLSGEEMALIKTHTVRGYELLSGTDEPFLDLAAMLAIQHHEHFDGTGYPYGLKGEEISPPSRLVNICDIYDALRQDRPYRRGHAHAEAMDIITNGDGHTMPSHFDPIVLSGFQKIELYVEGIYREHWHRQQSVFRQQTGGGTAKCEARRRPRVRSAWRNYGGNARSRSQKS
ncbi:MAG: HD domain-containing phosphohydrolase [Alphaproteobacteria bacterium]